MKLQTFKDLYTYIHIYIYIYIYIYVYKLNQMSKNEILKIPTLFLM